MEYLVELRKSEAKKLAVASWMQVLRSLIYHGPFAEFMMPVDPSTVHDKGTQRNFLQGPKRAAVAAGDIRSIDGCVTQ